MRRRDLLSGLGLGGYSLVVLADQISQGPLPPVSERLRREFDRIAPPDPQRRKAEAEPNMAVVDLETDVFIAGGGLAGVCAAIAAARNGAKVVLVQDRSRLGGNSSSEVKMHVVGANSHKGRPGWREGGLIEEFRLDDAANNPQRCWELWDLLLYDKVVSEPNITLLLETILYSATMQGSRIEQVMARCDKSEHLYRIKAGLYVDATGDSRLGLEAGAEYRTGRETRSEFNESLAPEKADQETLGSSILFTSRLHRKPMPYTPPKWARKVTKEHLRFRKVGPENWEYGYWWIEWGGDKDTIRDNERIRFELLSIVTGVWDYIKNSGDYPDSSHWALEWVGMMPGKRGSRRLVGDVILTQGDLMRGTWPDAVAMGGWPMDDHPPGGFDRSDLPPNTVIRTDEVFDIPLRALYSRNVTNLMMAGRNISASHAAFTSTRVMATCASIGQAVGTAAALCRERGVTPRQLARDRQLVSGLQQLLLRQDQSIRTVSNHDTRDLARTAAIKSSGEVGEAKAALVTDGIDRDIPPNKKTGKPGEVHHWAAKPDSREAWIELSWRQPQRLREVVLKFDTGFQRELTLSASDSISRAIVRAPQPETVRDYTVTVTGADGRQRTVATITGNHQRLNRITFEPVDALAVRITATKTNGAEEVRIFEVRCYA
ncbi:MAG: FAD-dependent oxidoreductase [Bryobacteraceae bacterium]|nr:FAD-dependent oxidoreductase [Bryobacterales bacterium]MEB2363425.1 FAD-dependent oxidoreductase [Bryobacterales bacterium]NUN00991.1 FAD-dependent oxidoreductase [Bryobacteraceae bacterium]